jgi:DNA polymerase-1
MENEYGVLETVSYDEAKKQGFEVFSKYADNDAVFTLKLYIDLIKQAKLLPKQYVCYKRFEMPFIDVLHRMNYTENQIRVDETLLAHYVEMIEAELNMVENILTESLGDINFSSTSQLSTALVAKGYEIPYTDKGNPSLSDPVIHKLADKYKDAVFMSLSYHRKLKKMATAYVYPLYERLVLLREGVYIVEGYEFIHIGARTGRMSATNPSLQVIPRAPVIMRLQFVKALERSHLIKEVDISMITEKLIDRLDKSKNESLIDIKNDFSVDIRKIFIPMEGNVFIGADFSQIELRMAAHLANDKNMIEEFNKDKADIHKKTAKEVSDLIGFELDRQYAKPINFGILYGLWHKTFARQAGIPIRKAKAFFEGWWNVYKDIAAYVKRVHKQARATGYVITILGRRRNAIAMGINEFNNWKRMNYAENSCISHMVSGSSADLIKVAMLNIHKKYPEVRMPIQVHDELLFEVKESEAKKYLELLKQEMENAMKLRVRVVADAKTGMSWRDVH